MNTPLDPLPGFAARAAGLAPAVAGGHYDELRGGAGPGGALAPHWARFFDALGTEGFAALDQRMAHLERQLRQDGIGYAEYAGGEARQRPWALDLFPLLLAPQEWQAIEAGVLQRTRLAEALLADVYGAQQLLARGLLPPALVHGNAAWLRPLHGVAPPGATWLHVAAYDLVRDAAGAWHVLGQRTQSPAGLGYLLENRLLVSQLFPQAFGALRVQRLAGAFRALADGLRAMAPPGEDARTVLLTPGPYNETYAEHAWLARYLGFTLAEGSDLTVRGERVFLKTLGGLEPVHAIVKRLDDAFLDPLELRPDSRLGVPGLVQAFRAGHLAMANAPGAGFLETPGLTAHLPAVARELLGESLLLPSSREPFAASQLAVWREGRLQPRPVQLRVFVLADGPRSWRVLPGGLVRLAEDGGRASSADAWVLTDGEVDATTLLHQGKPVLAARSRGHRTTSRTGENLFWLGRYTERTDNAVRLARLVLHSLGGEAEAPPALLAWLGQLASDTGLVLPGVPSPAQSRRVFERSLVAALPDLRQATSVGFNLDALRSAASAVRERLAADQWALIVQAEQEFLRGCAACMQPGGDPPLEALRLLDTLAGQLAAVTGAQVDRMARDDGWRLLASGRFLERLDFLAGALAGACESGAVAHAAGAAAVLDLFDGSLPPGATPDTTLLVQLLVQDTDNPRALAAVVLGLHAQLGRLDADGALAGLVPDVEAWPAAALREPALLAVRLRACAAAARALSDAIGARFFTHAATPGRSVGT